MKSCRFVANQLNAQHLKTAAGNTWSAQAVEDILKKSVITYNKCIVSLLISSEFPLILITYCRVSYNQHGIPKAKEPIPFLHRNIIRIQYLLPR